ncbi:MAG: hypothetical protein ACE5JB_04815 [bacterium]
MNSFKQLFSIGKAINKSCFCVVLFGFSIIYIACSKGDDNNEDSRPFLNIENGQFEVDAILITENGIDSSASPYGSGSISFDFAGDITGTFSVSGALDSNQTENDGVLAILNVFEDEEFETINEFLSLLGFHPTGDGKADVFVLGSKSDFPLSSIEPDNSYGIGTSAPFNGYFLKGLDIAEFWAGETNFIETADKAFVLTVGLISFASRDSTHFTGSFFGTTDVNQNTISKHFLLR